MDCERFGVDIARLPFEIGKALRQNRRQCSPVPLAISSTRPVRGSHSAKHLGDRFTVAQRPQAPSAGLPRRRLVKAVVGHPLRPRASASELRRAQVHFKARQGEHAEREADERIGSSIAGLPGSPPCAEQAFGRPFCTTTTARSGRTSPAGEAFWFSACGLGVDVDVHHLAALPADRAPDRESGSDSDAYPAGGGSCQNIRAAITR